MATATIDTLAPVRSRQQTWWFPFALLLVGHLPFVFLDLKLTWTRTHYQFFPFALGAFGWMLWQRQNGASKRTKLTRSLLILDVIVLLTGIVINSPWLGSIGMWLVLAAAAVSRRDGQTGSSLAYLALLPLLAVRLPANIDLYVITELQGITSRIASRLLNFIGILHLREGNIISLKSRALMVEEACSGVQSLFTLIFFALLICCGRRRSPFHGLLVLLGAVFFAGLMNVTRVVSIAIAQDSYAYDLSTGWQHDMLGYFVLGVAALLVYNLDFFLLGLTARVPDGDQNAPNSEYRNPIVAAFNFLISTRTTLTKRHAPADPESAPRRRTLFLCGTIAALGIAGQVPALITIGQGNRATFVTGEHVLREDSLPEQLAEFTRAEYGTDQRNRNSIEGEFSNTWTYQYRAMKTVVSCDHVFCGWHDLRVCYQANGWTVTSSSSKKLTEDWTAMKVNMRHTDKGLHGVLFFSFFTPNGSPHEPPDVNTPSGLIAQRLGQQPRFYNTVPDTIQCQAFLASPVPISETQAFKVKKLHAESRVHIRDALLTALQTGDKP